MPQQRRTETSLGELHHRIAELHVSRDDGTYPDTALRVAFRYGVDKYHVLLDTFEVKSRHIRFVGIVKLAVHLVGKEEQVVFLHDVADTHHLLFRVDIPRRIVRIADEDGLRTLVDERLEILYARKRITVAYIGLDGPHLHPRLHGERNIIGVCRLGHDNFITGIDTRREGELQRFRTARRYDDVFRAEVDAEPGIVTDEFVTVRGEPVAGTVLQHFAVDVFQGVESDLRRLYVRLSYIEGIYLDSPVPGLYGIRNEFPYRRCGHALRAL